MSAGTPNDPSHDKMPFASRTFANLRDTPLPKLSVTALDETGAVA